MVRLLLTEDSRCRRMWRSLWKSQIYGISKKIPPQDRDVAPRTHWRLCRVGTNDVTSYRSLVLFLFPYFIDLYSDVLQVSVREVLADRVQAIPTTAQREATTEERGSFNWVLFITSILKLLLLFVFVHARGVFQFKAQSLLLSDWWT